jgi:hypothetical protein
LIDPALTLRAGFFVPKRVFGFWLFGVGDKSQLYARKRGLRNPTLQVLQAIADTKGMEVSNLFFL